MKVFENCTFFVNDEFFWVAVDLNPHVNITTVCYSVNKFKLRETKGIVPIVVEFERSSKPSELKSSCDPGCRTNPPPSPSPRGNA